MEKTTTVVTNLASVTNQTNQTHPQKPSFDSLIDKTLLKIEVLTMSLAFTLALIGNLMVIFTLLFRRYVKKRLNYYNQSMSTRSSNAACYATYTGAAAATTTPTSKSLQQQTSSASSKQIAETKAKMMRSSSSSSSSGKFTRMNFFILNLSIADVYVSLGNILTMLVWRMNNNLFYGGDLACRAVAYFQLVSVYYSTYVLITMTIDRYEAICKPLIGLGWSKTRGFVYICIAFVLSHLQGIPQIIFFSLRKIDYFEPPEKTCLAMFDPMWLQSAYILYTFLMQFLIPLVIIIVCYASISLRVLESLKSKNSTAGGDASRKSTLRRADSNSCAPNSVAVGGGGPELARLVSGDDPAAAPLPKKHRFTFVNEITRQTLPALRKHHSSQYAAPTAVTTSAYNNDEFRQHCTKNFSRSKMKTIKLTLTVIILYIICSTPYFIGLLMNLMLDPSSLGIVIKYFMVLSCLLFQLNSCVNPWYVYIGLRFRKKDNTVISTTSTTK